MAGKVTVHTVGAVTVGDAYINPTYSTPPIVVGDPPQWDDNSDSTYTEQDTFENPDVSYADPGWAALQRGVSVVKNPALVTVKAFIRYQCLNVDMLPPNCAVEHSGTTGDLIEGFPPAGMVGSQSSTWVELTLQEAGPGRMQEFLDRVSDTAGTLQLRVAPAFLSTYVSRKVRTRIYEAYLVIQGASITPPCRNIKRGDRLDLGGARNYPPSKMQQTSSRGVGAY